MTGATAKFYPPGKGETSGGSSGTTLEDVAAQVLVVDDLGEALAHPLGIEPDAFLGQVG